MHADARRWCAAAIASGFPLTDVELQAVAQEQRLLDLDEALTRLEVDDPQKAAVVKLRFFAGLTNEEAVAA